MVLWSAKCCLQKISSSTCSTQMFFSLWDKPPKFNFNEKKFLFLFFHLLAQFCVLLLISLLTRLLSLAENLKSSSLHQPPGDYKSSGLGARPGWIPHCSALCSFQIWKIFAWFVWTSRIWKKQLIEEEIVNLVTKPVSKVRVGRYATI